MHINKMLLLADKVFANNKNQIIKTTKIIMK